MLHTILPVAQSFLFIYIASLLGRQLIALCRVHIDAISARVAFSILAGYGGIATLGLCIGLFGFFSTPVLWIICIAISLASVSTIKNDFRFLLLVLKNASKHGGASLRTTSTLIVVLYTIMYVWLGLNFLLTLVPITAHDTLFYHLPIMQTITSEKNITFTGDAEHYGYLPVLGEILYAVPIALFHNTDAPFVFGIVEWSLLPLFLLFVYAYLKKRIATGFLVPSALIMVLGIMDLHREVLHFGYVDMLAHLFGIGALFLIIERFEDGFLKKSDIAFAALLLGFGAAVKYSTLHLALFVGLFMTIVLIMQGDTLTSIVKKFFFLASILALVGGFWYIKNFRTLENPVYPMYSNANFSKGIAVFTMERTPLNMLIFPLYRWGWQWVERPHRESSSQLVISFYLIAMYLLMASLIFKRRLRWRTPSTALFIFVEGYLCVLFYSSHQVRFLLPGVMLLPLLLSTLADTWYVEIFQKLKNTAYQKIITISGTVMIVAALFLFAGNIHYFKIRFQYVLGLISETQYSIRIGSQ